jgi:hypothetical protein
MLNLLKRKGGALLTVLLIVAAAGLAWPADASAQGRGHAWGRYRARPARAWGYAPRYRYGYRAWYAYRPYGVYYYRPRYRVVVADPYWYDDDVEYVRPVYRVYHHHRPRVTVNFAFGSPGFYYGGYGDPYCW